jgi:hypothetical protein
MENWDIQKWIEQFKSIIEQEDLLYFYLLAAFILPFGLVYLFFYKEFPESIWILIFLTTIIFSVFFFIYANFFKLKKELKIKNLQEIETFLDTNTKDFEVLKNDFSEIKEIIEQYNTPYYIKMFIPIFKELISKFEKTVSEKEYMKSELMTARKTIESAKILFEKFILKISASFIFSMSLYWIAHIFYKFIITMNVFLIIYLLFFILLMFLEYLREIPIQLYFFMLFSRLITPLARRYTTWFKKYTKNIVTDLSKRP